jgi:hypothetical protein
MWVFHSKHGWMKSEGTPPYSLQVQENDEASCKSAFQAARSIRADEVKTYQKDLGFSMGSQNKQLEDSTGKNKWTIIQ